MGLKNRSRQRQERRKEKRERKEAQKAKYQALAASGKNSKSFRARKQARKEKHLVGGPSHPDGECGNVSCRRCSPVFNIGGALRWQVDQDPGKGRRPPVGISPFYWNKEKKWARHNTSWRLPEHEFDPTMG